MTTVSGYLLCTGVDTVKNDGFYSATLLNFKADGTFPVKVRATAKEGNQTRLVTKGGSRAFRLPVFNGCKYWLCQPRHIVFLFELICCTKIHLCFERIRYIHLKQLYLFMYFFCTEMCVSIIKRLMLISQTQGRIAYVITFIVYYTIDLLYVFEVPCTTSPDYEEPIWRCFSIYWIVFRLLAKQVCLFFFCTLTYWF